MNTQKSNPTDLILENVDEILNDDDGDEEKGKGKNDNDWFAEDQGINHIPHRATI